ncbi:MAG: hypothetical protein QNJ29_10510 [Rhizobiaceae bacterium]|nr:hypothetical protein [Rhizobiaceae bacterium]
MMIKNRIRASLCCTALFLISLGNASATDSGNREWRTYSEEPNGDIYYFDASQVSSDSGIHQVWNRIQYKTSIMGASSYQSLLEIDCTDGTEKIVQNTFFSDRNWERPAMSTDKAEKPKRTIPAGSATERLSDILCNR